MKDLYKAVPENMRALLSTDFRDLNDAMGLEIYRLRNEPGYVLD